MKVCVVAEYYPRRHDPVLGVWAHRQALAARDAGADVKVLVLERPIPPASSLRRPWRLPAALARIARQPAADTLDGIEVRYVRFTAGSRERTYATWHESAQAPLGEALAQLRAEWPFDLIHAHYALPAGGAALPFAREHGLPLVVSVHGGDVLGPLLQTGEARTAVAEVLRAGAEVLCNSRATLARVAALVPSDERLRVVYLGAAAPPEPVPKRPSTTVATVAHVIARKRHIDVLEAIAGLADPVDWLVIGDGPELPALRARAAALRLDERVHFAGRLPPDEALRELASAHVMALPSVDEAFGVAYIEALACGVPAIGCAGEGAEEIAAAGPGVLLVPPRDPAALSEAITHAVRDPELPAQARHTAAAHFSWQRCGRGTVAAYRDALAG